MKAIRERLVEFEIILWISGIDKNDSIPRVFKVSIVFDDNDWQFLAEKPLLFNKLFFFKIDHYRKTQLHTIDHSKVEGFLSN